MCLNHTMNLKFEIIIEDDIHPCFLALWQRLLLIDFLDKNTVAIINFYNDKNGFKKQIFQKKLCTYSSILIN